MTMKLLKKLMVVFVAVLMVMSLTSKVYAEESGDEPGTVTPGEGGTTVTAPTSGSITVNPNYKDQKYTLYKLFDAKISFDDQGKQKAITYQLPSGKTAEGLVYTDSNNVTHQWFKLDSNNNVVVNSESVATDWAKDPNAIKWAEQFGSPVTGKDPITSSADNDANVKWEGLDWGYYFVTSSLGSFIGVDSDNPDVTIQDKNSIPSVDKSITGVKDSSGTESGSIFDATEVTETADIGKGKDEQAIAQIGDTVSYKLSVTVKPGAKNYIITDNMTNLALVASSVKVDNASVTDNAKVDSTGTTITDKASFFTIKLNQNWLDSVTKETVLDITYDAILTSSAKVADEANPNTVKLTWGDKPDKNYSEDGSKVWTAKIDVEKHIDSENGEPLKGAGFKLKKGNLYYKLDNGVVTWVVESSANEYFTGDDGKLETVFSGLANGSYTLVETTIPEGYNKLEDTNVTIAGSDARLSNLVQTPKVVNETGATLPSTGGIGTTIFHIAGAALVLGAGILLISKKRMNNN
jgi:fimbrial isopeptide formation D2 family protein/LPXTG-motif cell wall-anchored protein